MPWITRSPVLFLIFNRPDTTARVFERIRLARPARLYVGADGPRPGRSGEAELCARTRALIQGVDWPCRVSTLFREANLGCREAVTQAITWFFENEEEGIILEDDCLPANDFFRFCDTLLERYRGDTRIRHITGCNVQQGRRRGSASYYFSRITHVWGWASWRRVWADYDSRLRNLDPEAVERAIRTVFPEPLVALHHRNDVVSAQAGTLVTWDFQLELTNTLHGGLSIIPNRNLISNLGFGTGGAHQSSKDDPHADLPLEALEDEITHPDWFIPDMDADLQTLFHNCQIERMRADARKKARLSRKVRYWFKDRFRAMVGLALCAAVCGLFSGCFRRGSRSAAAGPASGSPTQPSPTILRVGNGAEPQDLDSQTVEGVTEMRIIMALFDGLATPDPTDLHPVPGLAQSWDISPDGLVYTFHLRAGLRWSDGAPLTADDFIQSYKRMLTPSFGAKYSYLLWSVRGAEDYNHGTLQDFSKVGFQAPDERTLRVTLRQPTPYLLQIIACHYVWNPVPVKVIARFGPLDRPHTDWTRPGNLVACGAYVLKEWLPNQRIVVARNPLYWDAAHVKLDEIEFLPVEDTTTEENMFRAGQMDITEELPLSKIDVYRREHPEALHIDPYLGVYFYRLNTSRPPFTDKRVRRALALAIDRESLVRNVTRGNQQPAYAMSFPGVAGYVPQARLEGGAAAVAEARRLLAEAGYPDGRGFPTTELLYNTNHGHQTIAEAIQAMWKRNLGIDIRLRNEEWKVYLDSQESHQFDIERSGWIADYQDPNVFLEIWTTGNGNNDTLWSNPAYDRLYQQALAAPDTAARYALYQKMDAILVDECPVIPIYDYTRVYAMSPHVRGYTPTLLDLHPWKDVWIDRN